MRVVGAYIFDNLGARKLLEGVSLELPRSRIAPSVLGRLRIGDLLWVQEPWALVQSRQFGPQNLRYAVAGPPGTPPPAQYRHVHLELRQIPQRAESLARVDSRATLEVMGIAEHAVRVLVHMLQVDAFLAAGRAA